MNKLRLLSLVLVSGCLAPVDEVLKQATLSAQASTVCQDCPQAWSTKQGFVVHEWGTLTLVLGSDGTPLPGLHHEEEDLPSFVTDRVKNAPSAQSFGFSNTKMETPVTYFYSPSPLTVSAKVGFPHGLLTQWYPGVKHLAPVVFGSEQRPHDGWSSQRCAGVLGQFPEVSELDWGSFTVLARGERPALPANPGLSWDFARRVEANMLAVPQIDGPPQFEHFLFYRGLADQPPAFRPTFEGNEVVLENREALPRGGLVLMNVTNTGAGVTVIGDLAPGARMKVAVPEPTMALDGFVSTLKTTLTARLTFAGLYADEARAMVDTWERSYFLTPGVRLLYLMPQNELDAMLPLEISPPPQLTVRAMVIRLELQPPAREAQLSGWLKELTEPGTAPSARAHFLGLGRFAEPLLTRAQQLGTTTAEWSAAQVLLDEVRLERRWAPVVAQ